MRRGLTVVILTYQRPDLLTNGLPLVLEQVRALNGDVAAGFTANVVVIDNDPAGSARWVAAKHFAPDLRYVIETNPGIAAARNRALDEAVQSELLVFLDDDEQPRESWLAPLIATYCDTGAAGVMGRVVSHFVGTLDPWVVAGDFFERPRMATGTEIAVAATGNLLLDLEQVRRLGVRFNEGLGLSGGEDSLFTQELVRAGGRLVWCDESVADDFVPPERLTRRWLLARASSQGNTKGRVELYLAHSWSSRAAARARAVASGLARILIGAARYAGGLACRSRRHQARGLRTLHRGMGLLRAAAGIAHDEYARD